jgi:hypothetical protein
MVFIAVHVSYRFGYVMVVIADGELLEMASAGSEARGIVARPRCSLSQDLVSAVFIAGLKHRMVECAVVHLRDGRRLDPPSHEHDRLWRKARYRCPLTLIATLLHRVSLSVVYLERTCIEANALPCQ